MVHRYDGPICAALKLAVPIVTAILMISPLEAQDHDHGGEAQELRASNSADLQGGIPREVLERPLPFDDELTHVRHPLEGLDSEAGAHYEQGLTYQYLYHYLNAVRSFNQAIRADSAFLPAYSALSRALVSLGARDEGERVMERATELLARAGDQSHPTGRLLVELRAQALAARDEVGRVAYRAALDHATVRYPTDPELRMITALNTRGPERVDRLYEVLALAPDHVGAHHELVHAFEGRRDYERAVVHGAILSDLAPTVAHARHMHGHNLMRVGRVPDARDEFAAADSLERAYFDREEIPAYYDWHHPHNLHLLALTHWHLGEVPEAEEILRRRANLPDRQGTMASARLLQLGELLVAEGRGGEALEVAWDILEATKGSDSTSWTRVQGHLLAGEALLLIGDLERAQAAVATAQELSREAGSGGFAARRWLSRIELQLKVHEGRIEEGDDRLESVLEELLHDRGPDGWITSLLHLHALAQSSKVARDDDTTARVVAAMWGHDPTFRIRIGGFEPGG